MCKEALLPGGLGPLWTSAFRLVLSIIPDGGVVDKLCTSPSFGVAACVVKAAEKRSGTVKAKIFSSWFNYLLCYFLNNLNVYNYLI